MRAFEDLETAFVAMPTSGDVMERIRREDRCQANPLSRYCTMHRGTIIRHLSGEKPAVEVCKHCPHFADKLQKLMAEWEEWLLLTQELYG